MRERPQGVPCVLHHCFEKRNASSIAIGFLHLLDAAEIAASRLASLITRQTSAFVVGGQQVQMRADFFIEPLVGVTSPEHGRDAPQQETHHDPSSSSRDIIATVRDHKSASIDNCFFPARVIA